MIRVTLCIGSRAVSKIFSAHSVLPAAPKAPMMPGSGGTRIFFPMHRERAATIGPDGGCRTGYIGRFDEDGFLYFTGRIKEIYKMENGKDVSPGPLEEEFKLSPYINQALISGTNQRYNVAIIAPEENEVKAWAMDKGLDTSSGNGEDAPEIQTPIDSLYGN